MKKPVQCPACLRRQTQVVDKRGSWRRRKCLACHYRFNTDEIHEARLIPAPKKIDIST